MAGEAKRTFAGGLDAPERLAALTGGLLDRSPDPELQALVAEASSRLEAPIASVTLVMKGTQTFRAHAGLPPELAVSLATDRAQSLCQFVVARGEPLRAGELEQRPELPRELTERHGIRAYLGVPLRLRGQEVGTLCVLDGRPRQFGEAEEALLSEVAGRVALRLEALAGPVRSTPVLLAQARIAISEARSLLALNRAFAQQTLGSEAFERGLESLTRLAR